MPFNAYGSKELDVTDPASVHSTIKEVRPDVLVNCSAYTNVDEAEDEPDLAFAVNRDGVKNLAECCRNTGIKLIHYSTDYVFPGNSEDEKKFPTGYPENASCNPINMYGKSKREGEIALEESKVDYLLIRVAWLCGAHGTNFVKTMLRLSEQREELSVVDDQIGCPTFTFDVVEKSVELIRKGETGTFHLSSKGKISWADFAVEIFKQSGRNTSVNRVTTSEYPTKARRPAFSLLSTQKIEKLGLIPLDWQTGLAVLLKKLKK